MEIEQERAKASAVPAVLGDIQSWIAVNSFSALDAVHENMPIIDANELAKYIDSLGLSVSVPKGFISVPEGFVLMPKDPSEAIKRALSYQCFDFISVANVYRNLGFDIPKKAEDEQSFFLHKFLLLAITHGNDFLKVFNAETKAMVEAQEQKQ